MWGDRKRGELHPRDDSFSACEDWVIDAGDRYRYLMQRGLMNTQARRSFELVPRAYLHRNMIGPTLPGWETSSGLTRPWPDTIQRGLPTKICQVKSY